MGNLYYEIWKLRIRSKEMMVNLIFINKKDSFKVKIEIYY